MTLHGAGVRQTLRPGLCSAPLVPKRKRGLHLTVFPGTCHLWPPQFAFPLLPSASSGTQFLPDSFWLSGRSKVEKVSGCPHNHRRTALAGFGSAFWQQHSWLDGMQAWSWFESNLNGNFLLDNSDAAIAPFSLVGSSARFLPLLWALSPSFPTIFFLSFLSLISSGVSPRSLCVCSRVVASRSIGPVRCCSACGSGPLSVAVLLAHSLSLCLWVTYLCLWS